MQDQITRGEQNLILLHSMIPNSERLYIWCYDAPGQLIGTGCSDEARAPLDQAFRMLNGMEKALDYITQADHGRPMIVGSSIGLHWAVTFESEQDKRLMFVVGPVFYQPIDEKMLKEELFAVMAPHFATGWIEAFLSSLPHIPVMSYAVFIRYVLMIHNTLTGQQLGLDSLTQMQKNQHVKENPAGERDRLGVYQAEKALLKMVREGDINYQAALQNSILSSPGVPIHGKDLLRQVKTSITVFITLVSRAAMEGGLSPEIAYSLGDSYIQTVEDSRDSGELSALAHAMYHDFIYRVHHVRSNPNYSHAVQKCCDYIELSLDRKIRTAELAALVGYTEYYLTEKFKKETGKSISNYIRDAKITRAQVMLETTQLPIAEISDRLAFNTPNYFIQCFRDVTGCTPAKYRKEKQS